MKEVNRIAGCRRTGVKQPRVTQKGEDKNMKNHIDFGRYTPLLAILLVASASAMAKNSRSFNLTYPASLNGTKLAAGEYRVTWESHSAEVTVTFTSTKDVVATAQGKLVERDAKYDRNAVVYETNADGARIIMEIRFGGTKQAIVFGEPQ